MDKIDVAKIMADITCDVEKRYSEAAIKERERTLYADLGLNELKTELLRTDICQREKPSPGR